MLALLGLLLAGAEPSSYGFLTGKVNQALDGDKTRAFATNVVHHRANDSNNTMHNYEVQLTCMDHHATHNQLSVLKLTSPLHWRVTGTVNVPFTNELPLMRVTAVNQARNALRAD